MRTSEGHSVRQRASTIIRLVSDVSGAKIIFRSVVRRCDHETIGLPHSRRCQHMMALPAERFKIEYGDRSAIPSEPPSLARLRAVLASDGGGEGWPIPLVGLSIVGRLRNSNLVLCWVTTALQAEPPIPSQRPLDAAVVTHEPADVPADVPLKHW